MRDAGISDESGQLAEAEWLARYVATDGAGNLAVSISDLVRSGRLETGARLPTVRALGASMGVSPATVAAAWSKLRRDGIIETRRRGGTVVVYEPPNSGCGWGGLASGESLDLAQGLIDHALLPGLDAALGAALRLPLLHGAGKDHIIGPLLDAVTPDWPFKPSTWTTAGSGTEGALLAVEAALRHAGRPVLAIESPTSPRLLDLCRTLGAKLLAVSCDAAGPVPASLREALRERPAAFLYQPRAQIPLGHSVDETRTQALAEELARSPDTIAVEDDFLGPLARQPSFSIGLHLPHRTLYVRTYCNAFGIDLRTCVIGGAAPLIDAMRQLRSHGAAMNSRILQAALAFLLRDDAASTVIERARERYASRRVALAEALRQRGFEIRNRDGIGIWLAVRRESDAIIELAQRGVSVGAGSRCYPAAPDGQYLRLSTSRLPDDAAHIRDIADAFTSVGATLDVSR